MKKKSSLGQTSLHKLFTALLTIALLLPFTLLAQIYAPEGLNMPGTWNAWMNPPTNNLVLASSTQVSGGLVTKITTGTARYQTRFNVAASGANLVGGTYTWLYTSGSSSNYWANKWGSVTVAMNTLQSYVKEGSDNTITLTNGKWYTMNWKDMGYVNTQAIFMETSAQPVTLSNLSQASGITEMQEATITLTLSNTPCAEEKFYLRYTTNAWSSSTTLPIAITGTTGTATIPGQTAGTNVIYYAFSSTLSSISANHDMYTINLVNNAGANYTYTVTAGLGNQAEILTFTHAQQTGTATINSGAATIGLQVYYGTNLSSFAPTFTVSSGATASPTSGTALDYSTPQTYLVTAENTTTTKSWTATVSTAPAAINWCNLEWPPSGTIQPYQDYYIYAQAFTPNITPAAGQGAGIEAWIGYNSSNTDPSTWTNWIPASYFGDSETNDEYRANLGSVLSSSGTYYYASRFSINSGAYVYGGYSASNGGFWNGTTNVSGSITVSVPSISWANLQFPGTTTLALGQNFHVYGQVLVTGFTGQSSALSGMSAWIGISSTNADPSTWTTWIPATYNGPKGANDEYTANISSSITSGGTYYYATRFKLNDGSYVYGGYSATGGGYWNGSSIVNGVATITTPSIGWASLHYPASNTIEPSQPFNVYGRAYINGYTGTGTAFPTLQMWVGYSTENTNPSTWTNWISASYNGSSGANDEYYANLGAAMPTEGTYYYATRFKVYDQPYVYGGYSASGGGYWNGTTYVNGVLTVGVNVDCSIYNGTGYSSPAMPLDNQNVTIYFDATKGNQALLNYAGDVYAHTGVLTNLSSGPSNWRYIKTNWGTNTTATKLTRISTNLYSLTINTPRTYYGVPAGETIQKMVFVFRSDIPQTNGSYLEHRNSDGSDIAITVYPSGLSVRLNNPTTKQTILNQSTTLSVCASAIGQTNLALYANNTLLAQQAGSELSYMLIMAQLQPGQNWVKAIATNGSQQARDSVEIYLRGPVTIAELPSGVHNGINYINDSTVTLVLHDPTGFKQFVYAIGEFNNWEISNESYMKRTADGKRYWLTLTGLTPQYEYAYQYYIDGELKISDAYAEKVLDPWNDQYISSSIYPNPKPYPSAYTDGVVSIFQTARPAYNWQVPNFIPPAINNAQSDLVIYELLIRDFIETHSISDVQQKLDYLKNLGVNAIELMPIAEFDGNESWGYSTNFFFASDKYYGTRDAYKAFIDAAHQRGIAVILDIVPNHSFGLNPMVKMYFNSGANQPSEHNPWFNQQSPHGYSVGYDFNHESGHTRQFFKDVFQYWLTEFKVDGFRIDLSKGLTQKYSGGDIGVWNSYDQSRINILNDYKAHIKWVNPNAYVILEHFADNSEETVLANSGFMLWSAMHNNYKQVAMGWENNSNVSWAFHGSRGWNYPNLVDYMETHDEERMMSEALSNGNSTNPMYDIKWFGNALHHQEQGIVLFMGIPGPKMLYQFQEMGYDYSIMYGGGRTANKPPKWNYLDVPGRERLTRVVSAMAALRKTDAFRYGNFYHDLGLSGKKMWITHSSMDVIVTVNMGVNGFDMAPGFTKAGTWYNYFTGESFYVSNPGGHFFFYGPGEYKVFTSQPMPKPFHDLNVTVVDAVTGLPMQGVDLLLSNAGHRTTSASGTASFLALPQTVSVTATKFGWITKTQDTLVNGNINMTISMQPGWDPADGWVNLDRPGTGNIEPSDSYNVYAQVWVDGVTSSATADTTIEAWIGYSLTNTNPSTWTNWIPATYYQGVGNNDEYVANLGASLVSEGTYYYASRFRKDSGVFVYGGYSPSDGGFWNGGSNISGSVQVAYPPIEWANLQTPGSANISQGATLYVYGRVYMSNKTNMAGATTGMQAWIGYSTTNSNPATWTNWIPATYTNDVGNNDQFVANLGINIPSSGAFYYATKFQYKSGALVYGGYSTGGGGFWNGTTYKNGTLTITPPTVINWANIEQPGTGNILVGEDFWVYGTALVNNVTGQATQTPGLQAWLGYSTSNTNPNTWTNWISATYQGPNGTKDEFKANLGSQISTGGTVYYAYRYKLNSGSYYYGGYSATGGGFWNGSTNISGTLTINNVEKNLNLSQILLEGLYDSNGMLRQSENGNGPQFASGIADQITIELHHASNYGTIAYALNNVPLSTLGSASATIPGNYNSSYYITIKHRNCLEITSSAPISFSGSTINYSFNNPSLVYGNNLLQTGDGYYVIYCGDINQDGSINQTDMNLLQASTSLFEEGYQTADLNGDGCCDAMDMILLDNNAAQNRSKIIPL